MARPPKLVPARTAEHAEPPSPLARTTIAKAATASNKPPAPYDVRSERVPGLLLRVQMSGKRSFYVQVARGKRIRVGTAGVFTLKQAEEQAKKIMLDPAAFEKKVGSGITLREYIDDHYEQDALLETKRGAETVARVKALWPTLLNKRMADITADDVEKLRRKRAAEGKAPSTLNRDLHALSGVFTHWARNTKGALHPLAAKVKALTVAKDETVRYLTPAEAKRLRLALAERDDAARKGRSNANAWRSERGYELLPEITGYSDHLTPMVLLSLNTGIRQGELFSLAWEQIDFELKTLTVLASHAKGNKTRTVPINAEAVAVLQAIKPGTPAGLVFPSPVTGGKFDNVRKAWADVTKTAKLPDLRWHDLRHDFASQLVMRGVPLYTVQKLLGHTTPAMTQRYAKLAPGALADAVELLGVA